MTQTSSATAIAAPFRRRVLLGAPFFLSVLLVLLSVVATPSSLFVASFQVGGPSFRSGRTAATTRTTTTRRFLSPEHLGPDAVQALQHGFDAVHLQSSFLLLAADVGDAVADAAKEGGLKGAWMSYIALFEKALNLVHSTVDGPLRSVGFDQTWGVSIAIFTARTFQTNEISAFTKVA